MLCLRTIAAFLALLTGALFCRADCPAPEADAPVDEAVRYPLDRYDQAAYLQSLWNSESKVVYQESVLPLENPDGSMDDITLLYDVEEIISLRSSDLQTEYTRGVDYALVDGKLRILSGGAIDRVKYSTMYPPEEIEVPPGGLIFPKKDGSAWVWCEGGLRFHQMQLAVTYRHSDAFAGTLPARQGARLPKTTEKLESGGTLRVLVYGDSISVGAQSTAFSGGEPYAPTWFDMFAAGLEAQYEGADVTIMNHSLGGAASKWGVENAREAAASNPDLAIIAFGMNDGSGGVPTRTFIWNTLRIMAAVRAQNPDCEFILVATMLPHPETTLNTGLHAEYSRVLRKFAQKGVAVADMAQMHTQLLERKRYEDFNGNNINHPNDFLARVYAQVLLDTVET